VTRFSGVSTSMILNSQNSGFKSILRKFLLRRPFKDWTLGGNCLKVTKTTCVARLTSISSDLLFNQRRRRTDREQVVKWLRITRPQAADPSSVRTPLCRADCGPQHSLIMPRGVCEALERTLRLLLLLLSAWSRPVYTLPRLAMADRLLSFAGCGLFDDDALI